LFLPVGNWYWGFKIYMEFCLINFLLNYENVFNFRSVTRASSTLSAESKAAAAT